MASGIQHAAGQKESRRVAAVSSSTSPFGQNEWLVEEMYRKFREDPSSVDPSWHEFLVDYSPEPALDTPTTDGSAASSAPAAPAAPPERKPVPEAKPAAGNGAGAPAKPAPEKEAPEKEAAPAAPKTPAIPPAEGDEVQVLRGAAA